MKDLLKNTSITKLRKHLDQGEISSVELTQAYLQLAHEKSKELNCFISICDQSALAAAKAADESIKNKTAGAMTGIPIALKDNILLKGERATAGSKFLEKFIAPYDATVTKKLLDAGAVVIAKTNCDEFAMGSSNENSAYGPVHNPWKLGYAPGGSSGGSAACVAAQLAPGALGTDTGGSIRQPAAFCGLVGMKPTYGRVSRYGVVAFASSLDQVGPLTKTVKDNALVYETIAGFDPRDSTSKTEPLPSFFETLGQKSDLRGLKIGFPKEFLPQEISPDVRENFLASLETFKKLGAEIIDISLPHTDYGIACYYILAPAEASANLARFDGIRYTTRSQRSTSVDDTYAKSRSEGFGPEVRRRILLGTFVLRSGYYDTYYLKAQKVRNLIRKDFSDAFSKVDVILTPTAPSPAFPLKSKSNNPVDMYFSDAFTVPVSIAGVPGLSIPSGFNKDGLPMGIQLIGRPLSEASLYETAAVFENETRYYEKVPT